MTQRSQNVHTCCTWPWFGPRVVVLRYTRYFRFLADVMFSHSGLHRHIKYSLDFLRPSTTAEAFEAVDWLADLPPTNMAASRPVEWRHFVEVNSRNLGSRHVCWGSYDGFNFAGWRGRLSGPYAASCVLLRGDSVTAKTIDSNQISLNDKINKHTSVAHGAEVCYTRFLCIIYNASGLPTCRFRDHIMLFVCSTSQWHFMHFCSFINIQGGSKKSHYVWLPTSSKCLNQFAWLYGKHCVVLNTYVKCLTNV